MLVEEIKENPLDSNEAALCHDGLVHLWELVDQSVEKGMLNTIEEGKATSQVDGNGIHTNHDEEEIPMTPVQHIYNIIEEGEHQQGITSHSAYEGA